MQQFDILSRQTYGAEIERADLPVVKCQLYIDAALSEQDVWRGERGNLTITNGIVTADCPALEKMDIERRLAILAKTFITNFHVHDIGPHFDKFGGYLGWTAVPVKVADGYGLRVADPIKDRN